MYGELRSPNIHAPKDLQEYSTIASRFPNGFKYCWAGGTYIMTRPGFFPSPDSDVECMFLGEIDDINDIQRNDRYIEVGAYVNLTNIATAGSLSLPKVLLDNISAIACPSIRNRITLGGALCTRDFRSSIASTLVLLDANVETRFYKKKMVSKSYQISRLYDKNGKLLLPENGIVTKVKIGLSEIGYSFFFSSGQAILDPENSVSLAMTAHTESGNLSNAKMIITLPDRGFCYSRDINNTLSSAQFPMDDARFYSFRSYVFNFLKENNGKISSLREKRLSAILLEMVTSINQKILAME